jgi:hypothetical protein
MPFSPKAAADACISRCRRFLDLGSVQLTSQEVSDDLCRFALVNAVAAIDAYMHWLVFARLSTVRYNGDLPKSLSNLDIPFGELASLADEFIEAQQDQRAVRPWVHVKNVVQKRLLLQTFQSFEQVATAFALAGVEKAWSKVSAELGLTSNEIKQTLNRLVHRRNQMVHEGDITRMSRPRHIRYNPIDYAEVVADVAWVEALLNAMQAVLDAE